MSTSFAGGKRTSLIERGEIGSEFSLLAGPRLTWPSRASLSKTSTRAKRPRSSAPLLSTSYRRQATRFAQQPPAHLASPTQRHPSHLPSARWSCDLAGGGCASRGSRPARDDAHSYPHLSRRVHPGSRTAASRTSAHLRPTPPSPRGGQVLKYDFKEHYSAHHDFFDPAAYASNAQMMASIQNGAKNRSLPSPTCAM